MGTVLVVTVAIMAMLVMGGVSLVSGIFGGGIPIVVMILAIIVFGNIMTAAIKSRKHDNRTSRKELDEIKQSIARIEIDIGDIKEQIADFIINQV